MAVKKPKLRAPDIQGLKYFTQLQPLLARLQEVGCARDKAGNRECCFDSRRLHFLPVLAAGGRLTP